MRAFSLLAIYVTEGMVYRFNSGLILAITKTANVWSKQNHRAGRLGQSGSGSHQAPILQPVPQVTGARHWQRRY